MADFSMKMFALCMFGVTIVLALGMVFDHLLNRKRERLDHDYKDPDVF